MPALLTLGVVGLLVGRSLYSQRSIAGEYRLAARQAVANEELEKAKFYYSRLVGSGDRGTPQDQLNWVSILAASGDQQAAKAMLDELAPDDRVGLGEAHRQKVMAIAKLIRTQGGSRRAFETMHWHLRHGAREPTPDNDLLWAGYHVAVEQIDEAINRYSSAASQRPELWFEVAQLYRQLRRPEEAKRAMQRAEDFARQSIDENPLDTDQRLRLADILAGKGQLDRVEALLFEGLKLAKKDPKLKLAISKYYLAGLAKISGRDPDSDRQRLELIAKAAEISPGNPDIYKAMTGLYARSDTEEQKQSYRKTLETLITNGNSAPLAHFALGNFLFDQGDTKAAIFHLERAFESDPNLPIIANNLAWVLSQTDSADYVRAEKLARMALSIQPENLTFRDTLATILFEQEKHAEALPLFEKNLAFASEAKKQKIHQRLASIYEALGQPRMAASHRQQIQQSPSSPQAGETR
ncbi:MAG: tetratricopeptide repeat protein [Planctomycetota bacterium]